MHHKIDLNHAVCIGLCGEKSTYKLYNSEKASGLLHYCKVNLNVLQNKSEFVQIVARIPGKGFSGMYRIVR